MKARVLFYPESKKKLKLLGDVLCAKLSCNIERYPPAYNPENEKLVIIGVSSGKETPNELRRFCRELTKKRAVNTAFFFDAPKAVQTEIMNAAREAGTNVINDVFECKTGGIPLFVKVTEDEKKAIGEWCDKIVAQLIG